MTDICQESYDHDVTTRQELDLGLGRPSRATLPVQLGQILRTRIREGEWDESGWLPTEAELCAAYGVSRVTARQAMKLLESQGLVETRQGVGTRLTRSDGLVHAGLQELKSITETVREMGLIPSMEYRTKLVRPASVDEQTDFAIRPGAKVLQLKRLVRADGDVAVFLDDVLPLWVMGEDFNESDLHGSVFSFLAEHQCEVRPKRAVAEVRPRCSLPLDWQGDEATSEIAVDAMFLLLDQLQFDERNRPFMKTRAHFIDGRFSFVVLRLA